MVSRRDVAAGSGTSSRVCAGPGCDRTLERRSAYGPPPRYCSRRCKYFAHKPPPKPKLKDEVRVCGCGASFSPRTNRAAKFCSRQCAVDGRPPARGRGSTLPARICAGCRREFQPKGSDRITYCSRACYQQTLRDRPEVRVGWATIAANPNAIA